MDFGRKTSFSFYKFLMEKLVERNFLEKQIRQIIRARAEGLSFLYSDTIKMRCHYF